MTKDKAVVNEAAVTEEVVTTATGEAVAPETGEIVAQGTTEVAKVAVGSNYISQILEETKRSFVEMNQGLDLDFVRMGDWLTIDSKGRFVEKDDESVNYSDVMDVVVGYGEQRYSLWGAEDSPEKGQLIVADPDRNKALEQFGEWLANNPDAAERYDESDVKLRYMAYVVPVNTLGPDDFPKIYLMSFSQTDSFGWGKFAMGCFQGKFKALGIPARTAANKVVIRLETKERKKENTKWTGIDFSAVGLFNPKDFGIDPEAEAEAAAATE